MNLKTLQKKADWVRRQTFEMGVAAGKGHLGGAFSCVEILVAIYYGGILTVSPRTIKQNKRHRFILSKGHDCLPLYVILADLGFFDAEELKRHGKNGAILGGHPDHFIPGVEISSGSLGHGLGIGCGLSLAAQLNGQDFLTVVLLGDGECLEGSVWEAAAFASCRKLNNLIAIIDSNKIGATDFVKNYAGDSSLAEKWKAFGWEAREVDGHNLKEILKLFNNLQKNPFSKPLAIVAHTTKGRGVSYMENNPHWHHGVPKNELIDQARRELGFLS